jgi:hypothetical protein
MAELDPLMIDVSRDLERIDNVMTRIIFDDDASTDFKRDPNGTLVRFGLHPATSGDVNERVNRIFYAIVTNVELSRLVESHYRDFKPERIDEFAARHTEGLNAGRIENDLKFDLVAADHLFRTPDVMRRMFRLMLHDLNARQLLVERHKDEAIDDFVERLVTSITERKPIKEHPVLEEWDRNYGVGGFHFGAEAVEVGPIASVYTAVEVGLLVTVFGLASRLPDEVTYSFAAKGDRVAAVRLATISRIVNFGADLLLHAQQFEAR